MALARTRVSLSDQIANHLTDKIIHGVLQPGKRLQEAQLAKSLGVSTNTLREAYRIVEKRHLIEIRPRCGARVCEVTEQGVRDLYSFLFMLLSELAARLAERWQGDDLEDLVQEVRRMEEDYAQQDARAFHERAFAVIRHGLPVAGNQYLINTIEDLLPRLQLYSYIALGQDRDTLPESMATFRRLLENVLQRQPAAAARAIRDYGEHQCRVVLQAVPDQPPAECCQNSGRKLPA